jgi:hypothetical protein
LELYSGSSQLDDSMSSRQSRHFQVFESLHVAVIWNVSSTSMGTYQRCDTLQYKSKQMNPTTPTFRIRIMIGQERFMEKSRKISPRTLQNLLGRQ